jgi:hypothetical protein
VVIPDRLTLAGHVTPTGWTGLASPARDVAAAPLPFTARRCPPR